MTITLNQIGQVVITVDDVDKAENFYSETLGLKKLYRFGALLFLDCSGVRLLIEKSAVQPFRPCSSIIYFKIPDIAITYREFKAKGVNFIDEPHLIAPMQDHDLWMVFFKDPSENTLALMYEAPKGYQPFHID